MTKQFTLPVVIVHRGKVYRLSETERHGLVLQSEDGKTMDIPRGTCVIMTFTRVTLRSQSKAIVAQPETTKR